jgi:hypothetical protein
MFWAGIIVTIIGGLLPIPLFRNFIQNLLPMITDNQIDEARIILVIIGVSISSIGYILSRYEVDGLKDLAAYQEFANYNANGNKSWAINGVRMVPTPIDDWNKEFIVRRYGKIYCKFSSLSLIQCRLVIDKLPLFPFSYYFLALCLKENGYKSWIEYANKAKSILEKTTKLPGHHADHDLILYEVTILLRN